MELAVAPFWGARGGTSGPCSTGAAAAGGEVVLDDCADATGGAFRDAGSGFAVQAVDEGVHFFSTMSVTSPMAA